MSHLVFLVPGMGKNGPGWSVDVATRLKQLYDSYNTDDIISFEDAFELKELHYDTVFETIRQQWGQDLGPIVAKMKAGGLGDAADKLNQLNTTLTADEFFGTHVMDVLFYRFVETVKQAVRTTVANQILAGLQAPRAEWSIITHSLGTSVIHDTLHALYTHGDLDAMDARPKLLTTLANVSHVLESNIGAYDSLVRPAASGADGCCTQFLNVAHKLDPFTMVRPFHPPPLGWPGTPENLDRYHFAPLEEVYDVNVHDYLHYLNDPLTHVPLFKWLGVPFDIPYDVVQARLAAHKAGAPINQKLNEYKQKQVELEQKLKAMQQKAETLIAMIQEWLDNLKASQ